jgi:hypothetical protein
VAHAYEQIRTDLAVGTHHAPDFTHGSRRHQLLDRIQRAARAPEPKIGHAPSPPCATR